MPCAVAPDLQLKKLVGRVKILVKSNFSLNNIIFQTKVGSDSRHDLFLSSPWLSQIVFQWNQKLTVNQIHSGQQRISLANRLLKFLLFNVNSRTFLSYQHVLGQCGDLRTTDQLGALNACYNKRRTIFNLVLQNLIPPNIIVDLYKESNCYDPFYVRARDMTINQKNI